MADDEYDDNDDDDDDWRYDEELEVGGRTGKLRARL